MARWILRGAGGALSREGTANGVGAGQLTPLAADCDRSIIAVGEVIAGSGGL